MPILWFNEGEKGGRASLYASNLTLNSASSVHFERAEYAQIGKDEEGNLVLRPVEKEEVDRGLLEKGTLYPIVTHRSYARISSTALMSSIASSFGLSLSKEPLRFEASYSEKEGYLVVSISKGAI